MGSVTKIRPLDRSELRPSGIGPVPEIRWGEHVSAFYATADDLLEIVGGYFIAGTSGNEKCIWITSDPFTVAQAREGLREYIADVDERLANGAIAIFEAERWYLTDGKLDIEGVFSFFHAEIDAALSEGFSGVRAIGNAFWLASKYWESFSKYECGLSGEFDGALIIILCTYSLLKARAVDMLDIAKAHDFSIALRNGRWEFIESPEQATARRQIDRLNDALDILSRPFPGRENLTPRERITLAQIVRGASNKEAARALRISPRTVEFHRANIMRKLGARNIAELLGMILSPDNGGS